MSLLILDTSAVVAFAAGSVDVGEPIVEVHDEAPCGGLNGGFPALDAPIRKRLVAAINAVRIG